MKLCDACGQRPCHSDVATHCDSDECRRARARRRKRDQRARDHDRVVAWARDPRPELEIERSDGLLGHRARSWTRGGTVDVVLTIDGPDQEIPPMTGDTTTRCSCGLELRAPSEEELSAVWNRHEGFCIVVNQADHWSVRAVLRQRARPGWIGHRNGSE